MTQQRKWHKGPPEPFQRVGDKIIDEQVIFPKMSHLVISYSLKLTPPLALVTRLLQSGRRITGFQFVQLQQTASGEGTHLSARD